MAKKHPGWVYLLHFSRPYRHAAHYLGWAKDVDARVAEHQSGTGARLTQVVVAAGIELVLAWSAPGTRKDERRMKRNSHIPRRCPICRGVS